MKTLTWLVAVAMLAIFGFGPVAEGADARSHRSGKAGVTRAEGKGKHTSRRGRHHKKQGKKQGKKSGKKQGKQGKKGKKGWRAHRGQARR